VLRIKAAADAKLVVMLFFALREFEATALALGADGFVPKDAMPDRLPRLLDNLFQGDPAAQDSPAIGRGRATPKPCA
jgi:DNA-binding NarL/FixJ family response regulator